MSWYSFFTLKEDSKLKDLTIDDCKRKAMRNTSNPAKNRAIFLATMIKAYYNDNINENYLQIKLALSSLYYYHKWYDHYDYLKELLEDENREIYRNHCKSEYDMQDDINSFEDRINNIVSDFLVLSTVRFEADTKYSDTPKTTQEYLKTEYINEINESLDYLEDLVIDYTFAKFVLENCNRIEENEKCKEES